jgi:hypothetical protein
MGLYSRVTFFDILEENKKIEKTTVGILYDLTDLTDFGWLEMFGCRVIQQASI